MDAAGLARFIQHYERLTRHILAEMPGRADLVVELARDRSPRAIRIAGGPR
jgi:D-glycerate 3-kinase